MPACRAAQTLLAARAGGPRLAAPARCALCQTCARTRHAWGSPPCLCPARPIGQDLHRGP
eukprot:606380-Alexandrium_andersonii.AAC.1